MLRDMLASDNALVKYGVGALVVFGPLYILSSYGVGWVWPVAITIFLGVLIRHQKEIDKKRWRF